MYCLYNVHVFASMYFIRICARAQNYAFFSAFDKLYKSHLNTIQYKNTIEWILWGIYFQLCLSCFTLKSFCRLQFLPFWPCFELWKAQIILLFFWYRKNLDSVYITYSMNGPSLPFLSFFLSLSLPLYSLFNYSRFFPFTSIRRRTISSNWKIKWCGKNKLFFFHFISSIEPHTHHSEIRTW